MNEFQKLKTLKSKDVDDLLDSDKDEIYDNWETGGYTVEKSLIVAWDDAKHKDKGYIKYHSDPAAKYTAGDPFSDSDKVLKHIDGGTLHEARHPLVAACPEIIVVMEKLVLSKNQNTSKEIGNTKTDEKSQTVATSTTNSQTESQTVGASVTANASLLDMGVSVSANYSNEWSNTVTVDTSDSSTSGETLGKSWTSTLGINTAEAAFLNGNVRYINAGTAPIYQAKPTLNFVLGIGKDAQTISTVVAKSNTVANVLLPNSSYPEKSQNAIAFSANDDFNSQPIKLNYEQVMNLAKGKKLQIETTQTDGLYKKYNEDGDGEVTQGQMWSYAMPDIISRTACITLELKNALIKRRRISAREQEGYDTQTQPELTLKEAIELAFPPVKIDEKLTKISYKDNSKNPVDIIVDQNTHDQIAAQITKDKNLKFFETKLYQGMNITIIEKFPEDEENGFNQVIEKLKYFDGSSYEKRFDLNEAITLDSDLQNDMVLLKNKILEYLSAQKINADIIKQLKLTWPYGVSGNSLRSDNFRPDWPSDWFKNIKVEFKDFKGEIIKIYFKNILIDKPEDKIAVVKMAVNKLKMFDGAKQDAKFDLKHNVSLSTNLGKDWIILKTIVKSYLSINQCLPHCVIKDLNIEWAYSMQHLTLNDDGFKISDENNWYKNTTIKYESFTSDTFKLYFTNIAWLKDAYDKAKNTVEKWVDFFKTLHDKWNSDPSDKASWDEWAENMKKAQALQDFAKAFG